MTTDATAPPNPSGSSRVLVTGANGFVGTWLVPELADRGLSVVGLHKPELPPAPLPCEWLAVDLRDRAATLAALQRVRPTAIVHLAAIADPRGAQRDPEETLRMNYGAVDHLLRGVAEAAPTARLLLVSSGQVYGPRAVDAPPAREGDPLSPPNLYAASKAAAEQRAEQAFRREGLDVVRLRPFNHTGPGRPPHYAESNFARQIAEIERGRCEPVVRVGNLEAVRDFCDVRDVVRAYALVLDRGRSGDVYNVCSGRGRTLRSVVDELLARARVEVAVEVEPSLYVATPPDALASVGDATKLRALGWEPRQPFEETLAELLDDWRERV